VTPLQLATGFAVLANGGFRVESWLIERIDDVYGRVLFTASPKVACPECEQAMVDGGTADDVSPAASGATAPADPSRMNLAPRVIDARDAYVMYTMMQDVIRRGTGQGARVLGREDLAGKTGTTNDQMDAWFAGFNREMVATAWVGFDQLRPLGERETGARAALPMWVAFMKEALRDVPESPLPEPPGLTHVQIDPSTGSPAHGKDSRAVVELYRAEAPPTDSARGGGDSRSGGSSVESLEAPLF
jgi:penicillin-binding protein 1A